MRLRQLVLVFALFTFVAPAFLAAAGQAEPPESTTVGISKIVAHPALDSIEQGIIDELQDLGYSDLEFDLQNANGEITTAASIANKFQADGVLLAVGIATPTSQALVNSIDSVPVVFSAVTDPLGAGIVESIDGGNGNVTGVSDLTPVREQIEFLVEMAGIERLGHIYTSSEANAVTLANMAREASRELGIEFVEATVTNSSEVRPAAQSLIGRVDGIYVSNDNTVVSALTSLVDVANGAGVPVMSADPTSAEEIDVLAAWGYDYYKMGRFTGEMIAEILEGADPDTMEVRYMTDPSDFNLVLNLDVAEELGLSIPQRYVDQAATIIESGQMR